MAREKTKPITAEPAAEWPVAHQELGEDNVVSSPELTPPPVWEEGARDVSPAAAAEGMRGLFRQLERLRVLEDEKSTYRFHVLVWEVDGAKHEIYSFDQVEGAAAFLHTNLDSGNFCAVFFGEAWSIQISDTSAGLIDPRGVRHVIDAEPEPARIKPIARLSRNVPRADVRPSP